MATKEELLKRAADCEQTAGNFLEQAKKLRETAATLYEYPAMVPWRWSTIEVRLRGDWGWTTYIVVSHGGRWIVTRFGQTQGKMFDDWESFIDWLRSDDVQNCGDLRKLGYSGAELVVP